MKISEKLKEKYRDTNYCVNLPDAEIVLRVGQYSPRLKSLMDECSASGAVFITAWNPFGVVQGATENISANALLEKDLIKIASFVFPGYGASPESDWREESLLALPVSMQAAKELCSRYAQNAVIFIGSDSVPELVFHPLIANELGGPMPRGTVG
jgi:hypothetical protein